MVAAIDSPFSIFPAFHYERAHSIDHEPSRQKIEDCHRRRHRRCGRRKMKRFQFYICTLRFCQVLRRSLSIILRAASHTHSNAFLSQFSFLSAVRFGFLSMRAAYGSRESVGRFCIHYAREPRQESAAPREGSKRAEHRVESM